MQVLPRAALPAGGWFIQRSREHSRNWPVYATTSMHNILNNLKNRPRNSPACPRARKELLSLAVCWVATAAAACGAASAPVAHRHAADLCSIVSPNSRNAALAAPSGSAQNGKVIGLDLLSSHYFGLWRM